LNESMFQRTDSIVWNNSDLSASAVSMEYNVPQVLAVPSVVHSEMISSEGGQCREGALRATCVVLSVKGIFI
jgi:hypothetical protein